MCMQVFASLFLSLDVLQAVRVLSMLLTQGRAVQGWGRGAACSASTEECWQQLWSFGRAPRSGQTHAAPHTPLLPLCGSLGSASET